MLCGIDRLLADPGLRAPLKGKRVALLAHPLLEDVAGEFVGHGEQGGVAEQPDRPGEPDEGALLGTDVAGLEGGDRPTPHRGEVG